MLLGVAWRDRAVAPQDEKSSAVLGALRTSSRFSDRLWWNRVRGASLVGPSSAGPGQPRPDQGQPRRISATNYRPAQGLAWTWRSLAGHSAKVAQEPRPAPCRTPPPLRRASGPVPLCGHPGIFIASTMLYCAFPGRIETKSTFKLHIDARDKLWTISLFIVVSGQPYRSEQMVQLSI